jgi:hypothetical protein
MRSPLVNSYSRFCGTAYTLYRSVMGLLLFVVLGEQKFTPWLTFRYSFNWSFCTVEKRAFDK